MQFSYNQYSEGGRYFLRDTIIDNKPTFRTDSIYEAGQGTSVGIGFGYHFFPSKNLRPYVYAGFKFYNYSLFSYNTAVYEQPPPTLFDEPLDFFGSNIGVGLDWYFLSFNQIRLQASHANGFEYYVGYGFNLTF